MVHFFTALLIICSLAILWIAGYVVYRTITDES